MKRLCFYIFFTFILYNYKNYRKINLNVTKKNFKLRENLQYYRHFVFSYVTIM